MMVDIPLVCGDHPRVCGEKKENPDEWNEVQGSPPRMRGKEFNCTRDKEVAGITPAYAGKSTRPTPSRSRRRDHPRVCGEKDFQGVVRVFRQGSPPRMRGKGRVLPVFFSRTGITPAYAGKRPKSVVSAGRSRDHPRVCGEKKEKRKLLEH